MAARALVVDLGRGDIGEVVPGSPGTGLEIVSVGDACPLRTGSRLSDVATTSAVRVLSSYSRTMCSMAQLLKGSRRGEAAAEWILP